MSLKVFYHDDPDGWASARIFYKALNDGRLNNTLPHWPKSFESVIWIPIQYGEDHKFKLINTSDYVVMMDFSAQPFDKMIDIAKTCLGFLWIDHHKSAIEDAKTTNFCHLYDNVTCFLKDKYGACYHVFEFFYPDEKPPKWLELIAKADVWIHEDDDSTHHITEFMKHYSNQLRNPKSKLWEYVESLKAIKLGKMIFTITLERNIEFLKKYGFETSIDNYSAICVNMRSNSLPFEKLKYDEKYDIMVTFYHTGRYWTVSMFSKKDGVDVSQIAKKMGGGGHKNASGFQCNTETLIKFLDLDGGR